MKIRNFFVPMLLCAALLTSACGHSLHIMIDPELKENSELLKVNRKTLSSYKMDFGGNRLIYGTDNLYSYDYVDHGFFYRLDSYSETRSQHLILLAESNDTLYIDLEINADIESFTRGLHLSNWIVLGGSSFISRTEYYAEIQPKGSDKLWELQIVLPRAKFSDEPNYYLEVLNDVEVQGILTDGRTHFTIQRVERNQQNRKPVFKPRIGYLFYIGEMPVAAVQTVPHRNQRLWLHNDLKQEYRDLISAASAAIMVFSRP
jgi:hypothetical protein